MCSEQKNSPQILSCFIRQFILSLFRSFRLSDRFGFPAFPAFLDIPAFWLSRLSGRSGLLVFSHLSMERYVWSACRLITHLPYTVMPLPSSYITNLVPQSRFL